MEKKKRNHLPLYGVGPLYVYILISLTSFAALLRNFAILESGKIHVLKIPLTIIGILTIILGIVIWFQAVVISEADQNIVENRLVTSGIYAWVRNPIYSSFMIACTGILLIIGNLWFFLLPLLYWLFMTVLMKSTEEKWLLDLYGTEYTEYCKKTNRCWPWFPKK